MIISFVNCKGGVGKTAITFNLAGIMSSLGKKILVLDNDYQSNLTHAYNVNVENNLTMYDIFSNKRVSYNECIVKISEYIDFVPNTIYSVKLEDELSGKSAKETILKRKLDTISSNYDYILIDNNPYIGIQTKNALCMSNYYLGVIDTNIDAILGINILEKIISEDIIDTKLNDNIECLGIIWNKYAITTNYAKEVAEYIEKNLTDTLFKTRIKNTVRIKESRGLNISVDKFNSELKDDFNKLYVEIKKRIRYNNC